MEIFCWKLRMKKKKVSDTFIRWKHRAWGPGLKLLKVCWIHSIENAKYCPNLTNCREKVGCVWSHGPSPMSKSGRYVPLDLCPWVEVQNSWNINFIFNCTFCMHLLMMCISLDLRRHMYISFAENIVSKYLCILYTTGAIYILRKSVFLKTNSIW